MERSRCVKQGGGGYSTLSDGGNFKRKVSWKLAYERVMLIILTRAAPRSKIIILMYTSTAFGNNVFDLRRLQYLCVLVGIYLRLDARRLRTRLCHDILLDIRRAKLEEGTCVFRQLIPGLLEKPSLLVSFRGPEGSFQRPRSPASSKDIPFAIE